jgi:branched-chain amino acid transport system ATP-binding protein
LAFDPPAARAVLELSGLTAGYRERSVLKDVSLALSPGDSVALIGPNGCGKSTLFRVIAGLLRPSAGSMRLAGTDLAPLSPDARARLGLGYLKQTANVFTSLSVRDNLLLAAEVGGGGQPPRGRLQAMEAAFPDLRQRSRQRAGLLSGGQRQALAIAMVLSRQPAVLLLDEPIAGLSPAAGQHLLATLRDLGKQEGFALLIVEHRLRQLQPFIDRVLVMREGSLVATTSDPKRLLDPDWLASHYRLASQS